jgi:hypothetical protein
MASKRRLLDKVERLLDGLLNEAQQIQPATFDADGIETSPARVGATFGERLKLAEVVTVFETRRSKLEEDEAPSDIDDMLGRFHGHADRAPTSRANRKARAPESNGVANGGHALPSFDRGPRIASPDE